ncbi:hypothetical protein TNCV_3845181 [Trichonephila clavipes]|nr:hypothetical protein TNCV_3845181 [Trichonephila clavipes]
MPRHWVQAHYEHLSQFERGCIIGLKEAFSTNQRIVRHMSRNDAAIRRCCAEFRLQLCSDDHRRRVRRGPGQRDDPALTFN